MSRETPLPPAAKASLAWEVAVSYLRVRRSLRDPAGIKSVVASMRAVEPQLAAPGAGADSLAVGRRLGRAVGRTLALLPGDTRCLSQSLVLTRLLARRGIESRLVIGVRPGERFAAHAWVEHAGKPLLPPGAREFEELVTL